MRAPSSLSQHRTFRWNDGADVDRYEAVETRDDGLLWYAWSHRAGGGRHDEHLQPYEALERDGPPREREVPPRVLAALRAWIAAHRPLAPEERDRGRDVSR